MTIKNKPEPEPINTSDFLFAVTVGGWALILAVGWLTGRLIGWW